MAPGANGTFGAEVLRHRIYRSPDVSYFQRPLFELRRSGLSEVVRQVGRSENRFICGSMASATTLAAPTFMPATLVEAIASPIDGKTNMSLSSQISSRTWPNGAEDALRS